MMSIFKHFLMALCVASNFLAIQAEADKSCQSKTINHATSISIGGTEREALIKILNRSLATLTDLFSATKNAHWNVKGENFYALHLLFDEIAKGINEFNDTLAERVTALGGTAAGTIQEAVNGTSLEQYPNDIYKGKAHVEALAQRFAKAGAEARQAIKETENLGDSASSDIFIDITRTLDKYLWFLEAHLQ